MVSCVDTKTAAQPGRIIDIRCPGDAANVPGPVRLHRSRTVSSVPMPSGLCECGCGEPTTVAEKNTYRKGVLVYRAGEPRKFLPRHYAKTIKRMDPLEQVMAYVEKTETCWLWTGALNPAGYGWVNVASKPRVAHLVLWELVNGPVPEPVTHQENMRRSMTGSGINARKTYCIRGHEFTEANTYHPPKRPHTRQCRECVRIRQRRAA